MHSNWMQAIFNGFLSVTYCERSMRKVVYLISSEKETPNVSTDVSVVNCPQIQANGRFVHKQKYASVFRGEIYHIRRLWVTKRLFRPFI